MPDSPKAFAEATASDDKLEQQCGTRPQDRPDNPGIHRHAPTAFGHMQHPFYQGQGLRIFRKRRLGAGRLAFHHDHRRVERRDSAELRLPSGPRYTGTKPWALAPLSAVQALEEPTRTPLRLDRDAREVLGRHPGSACNATPPATGHLVHAEEPAPRSFLTNLLNVTCEGRQCAAVRHVAFTRHFIHGRPWARNWNRWLALDLQGTSWKQLRACALKRIHQVDPKYESSVKSLLSKLPVTHRG